MSILIPLVPCVTSRLKELASVQYKHDAPYCETISEDICKVSVLAATIAEPYQDLGIGRGS